MIHLAFDLLGQAGPALIFVEVSLGRDVAQILSIL